MTRTHAPDGDSRARRPRATDAASGPQPGLFVFWGFARSWAGVAGPVAAGLLFIFLADLTCQHLNADRVRALEAAALEIDMRAGEFARRLDAALASEPSTPVAETLRAVLAANPGLVGGEALLANSTGLIVAREPSRPIQNLTLATLLSSGTPLTILADKAGAMRVKSSEGEELLAAVRNLAATSGQVAVTAPVNDLLAPWWATARVMIALLAATGFALGGSIGALRVHAVRASARAVREALKRAHIELALTRGRCGLWDWDLERGRVTWSRSMFELLGLSRCVSSLSIGDLQAMLHPDDESLERVARAALAAGGGSIDVEFRMRGRDGQWVWLRKRAEIVEDNSTGGRRLVGIAIDVTDRKREAEISATADQRLREAVEAISEAFVLWDSSNRLVLCNSKYRRLHDLPAESAHPGAAYAELAAMGSTPIVSSEGLVNPNEPGAGQEDAKTYEARTRRRTLAAGERTPHARRRVRLCRHRHHRAQRARGAVGEIGTAAARDHRSIATIASFARSAGSSTGRPRRTLSRGKGAGRNGQPRQGRIPGQHEPRAANAIECDHRFFANDGGADFRPDGLGEISRILRRHPIQRTISAERLQRRARDVAARIRARQAQLRSVRRREGDQQGGARRRADSARQASEFANRRQRGGDVARRTPTR